jgi:hypothetical protein
MVREERKDPVAILAHVSGPGPQGGDPERAYQVWVHFARKAGWNVTETPGFQGLRGGTECGRVEIEGLEYRVHYGLRVRLTLVDDSDGRVSHRPILDHAAWAEPDLGGYTLE